MKNKLKKLYGFLVAASFLATGVLIVFLLQVVYLALGAFPKDKALITSIHLLIIVASQALVFILLALYMIKHFDFIFYDYFEAVGFKEITYAFLGLGVTYVVIGLVVSMSGLKVNQFEGLDKSLLTQKSYLFLISIGVIAPFYEEFIFRSLLLASVINFWGEPKNLRLLQACSLIFISILFSIVHYEGQLSLLVPIFILSIYLGLLALWRKNIFLSIIIHMFHNIISGIGILYLEKLSK